MNRAEIRKIGACDTMTKYIPPRICIACHAKEMKIPVVPSECLGFAKCEECTLVENGQIIQEKYNGRLQRHAT